MKVGVVDEKSTTRALLPNASRGDDDDSEEGLRRNRLGAGAGADVDGCSPRNLFSKKHDVIVIVIVIVIVSSAGTIGFISMNNPYAWTEVSGAGCTLVGMRNGGCWDIVRNSGRRVFQSCRTFRRCTDVFGMVQKQVSVSGAFSCERLCADRTWHLLR